MPLRKKINSEFSRRIPGVRKAKPKGKRGQGLGLSKSSSIGTPGSRTAFHRGARTPDIQYSEE